MSNKKDRIEIEQDIVEAFQESNENRREDIFISALENLPFSVIEMMAKKYVNMKTTNEKVQHTPTLSTAENK